MNATILRLAAQALLGRRRFWLLLAFPVLLVALTVLVAALTDRDAAWPLLPTLGYPVVLPLVAVLAASSVLGPEVDDGSIVYLIAKPVSRHAIAVSKWAVAWAATMLAGALPLAACALVAGGGDRAAALGLAAVVAGTTYSGLFLAVSALTRHAVIASLLFVLIWEGLLGNLLSGVAWLSVAQWGLRIGHVLSAELPHPTTLPWALLASAALTVGGVWFAGDRLRSFSLRGEQ